MTYYLYAGFAHKYGTVGYWSSAPDQSEVALVERFETFGAAEICRRMEELAWSDEGLSFKILTEPTNPGPSISYEKLQEMVMK